MTTPTNHPDHTADVEDDDCHHDVLPGVLTDMDFLGGIQRCDSCGKFDGDLDAAQAAADLVGGTVWCMVESDQVTAPEGVRTQWRPGQDVTLVTGNNPWVELDGVVVIWQYTRLLLDAPHDLIHAANKLGRTWELGADELVEAIRATRVGA